MAGQWVAVGLFAIIILLVGGMVVKALFFTSVQDLRKQTRAFLEKEGRNKKPRQNF